MRAAGDGVVVTNDALVLEAKDGVRIEGGGPRPIRRQRIGGRVSKACIETREEICEVRVRAVTVPHAGEAELTAEPILEGAKEPLDATLGLRAVRGDPVDAQFLQGAFDLCGRGFSGQLLLEGQRACGGPVEDAMAIAVGGDGDAFGLGEGVKDVEIAVRIFLVAKGGGEHFSSSIVHDGDEGEARAALFQPVVVAPVDLHEQAGLGHPLAPAAVAWRAAMPRAAQSRGPQDAVDGGLGQREAFAFGQELAEVGVVDPRVGSLGEVDDPRADGISHAPRRETTAVPMDHRLGAVSAIGASQAADLTGGEGQEVGRLGHPKLAAIEGTEYDELLLRAMRQGNHPPRIRLGGGRTFSLNR